MADTDGCLANQNSGIALSNDPCLFFIILDTEEWKTKKPIENFYGTCTSWILSAPAETKVAFDWPYSGIRISGIAVKFLFFKKSGRPIPQTITDTWEFKSRLLLQ